MKKLPFLTLMGTLVVGILPDQSDAEVDSEIPLGIHQSVDKPAF